MARITVEDCLRHESNRFALVRLASKRAKQLLGGKNPVTDTKGNKAVVSALREIADGKVRFKPKKPGEQGERRAATIETSAGPNFSSPAVPVSENVESEAVSSGA